jgi:ssDNA-binding Zn-finger/Zn-ribbon topoisomerase 1
MSWGALYIYYRCPECNKLYKYATDLIVEYGDEYGYCPECNVMGEYVTEGARIPDDLNYAEVD